ncbi:LegC family aminotransferase [Catenovulum agarivorans]|uniref:LegC family aminotransferase n=1 Tax=Catenovulum agarivorans TaxID=1172192 RepID=UPI0002E47722|nr:LegC family aminotransferase [Catenovulum agarivorans]
MKTLDVVKFIQDYYQTNSVIPLHAPYFNQTDKDLISDTIDSTFVSTVGRYVDLFEQKLESFTGSNRCIATVNGTSALHVALSLSGVGNGDFVITQALSFVATANAIKYCGASPIFIDVDTETLGLSPSSLETYLSENAQLTEDGACIHVKTKRRISAIVPMHTLGHPCDMDELCRVANDWNLPVVEDAAESLGSTYKSKHCGTIASLGATSFNGNKIITTGGGGAIFAQDSTLADRAKHLTTTAKVAHAFEMYHDELGYNYRMPNLNAALGCAQIDRLPEYLNDKRRLANLYRNLFEDSEYQFIVEPQNCKSNYWLNAIRCPDVDSKQNLIEQCIKAQILVRPLWQLLHTLPHLRDCEIGNLSNSVEAYNTIVCLPSSIKSAL